MIDQNTQQIAKYVADGVSFGTVVGTLLGYLPTIAAALSIVWISIQIWESKTALPVKTFVCKTFRRVFRRK